MGSFIEIIVWEGWQISFVQDDSLRDLFGPEPVVIHQEYDSFYNPVDISFDNFFVETDIVPSMIFKGRRSAVIHNFKLDVDPGYKSIAKFQARSSIVHDGNISSNEVQILILI